MPRPTGAIQAFFNVSSISQLFDDFAVIMPDFLAANENFTIDLNLKQGLLYHVKMTDMRFEKFDLGTREIAIIPGQKYPFVRFDMREVNFAIHVTGGVYMGGIHMFNFTEVRVDDLKIVVELGVETDPKSGADYWQVHGVSQIDFKNIHIGTDSLVFSAAIDVFHQVVVKYLKADEKGYKSAFKKSIDELNILLRTHIPVMLPSYNHHLFNATIPTAPILDAETQIAEIALDGTFYDNYLKTSHVPVTTTKA